jgi:hypothetical protein
MDVVAVEFEAIIRHRVDLNHVPKLRRTARTNTVEHEMVLVTVMSRRRLNGNAFTGDVRNMKTETVSLRSPIGFSRRAWLDFRVTKTHVDSSRMRLVVFAPAFPLGAERRFCHCGKITLIGSIHEHCGVYRAEAAVGGAIAEHHRGQAAATDHRSFNS